MSRGLRKSSVSCSVQSSPVEAPPFQNWSCFGCTDCCRGNLLIVISEEEKRRIEAQGWNAADGVEPDAMIIAEGARLRLGHQPDGACIFLEPSGRCRIHAKFGEAAKPLACRLYPLAIHPAGGKLVVSLHFACPSAAENRGRPLAEQIPDIRKLAALVVPADYRPGPAPAVLDQAGLEWADFQRYMHWLDRTLSPVEVPAVVKMCRTLHWLKAVEKARFDQLTGSGADEILEALVKSAIEKVPDLASSGGVPSRFAKFCLRHLVLESGRAAKAADAALGSSYRWKKLWALLRFVTATGSVPALGRDDRIVRFAEVEKSFGPLPPAGEAALTRYLRVKVQGQHFCGPAYHGFGFVEGVYSLALGLAAILWLARWRAAVSGRNLLSETDVTTALRLVDHHHGHAGTLSIPALRRRVRLLAQRDDLAKLCCWNAW